MFKYVLFAALLAFAAAKPLVYEYPVAYTAPALGAAYTAPLAYSAAYTSAYSPYYSPYAYSPYSAFYYR